MNKAKYYIEELNAIDEHVKIEAKQCSDKIDKSVLETICSFSNEPELEGGVIIIGLHESEDSDARYSVVGVNDADKLQKDLATQCANMFNHPVRPLIEVDVVDGKKVLIIEVQELDAKYKPLYFKDAGLPKGAWRRIGSTDHRCTEEDLHILFHEADDFDTAIAKRTDLDDIDENAVSTYRRLRAAINPKAEELNYSDKDLLRSLNCIEKDKDGEWKLTNTGLLVFGKSMALRRELPAVRVDYIRVTGTEWLPDPHNRFESIDMRGPLLLMVNRAFNAIADDLPRGFSLSPGNLQANRPLPIPDEALREAIVNSLIHQNFRIHQPIQIIRYSNRIEIINPGFSLKPAETLGEPGSRLRNPTISSIFHETQLAEAKGTGIGTMRRLMKEAAMVPPTFESDYSKNTFTTRILLHHFLSESDLAWFAAIKADKLCDAQKVALVFVREVGAIDNITYRQLSGTSAKDAKKELKTLVNLEFIKSKGQGRKTYYIPTERLKSLCTNGVTLDGKVTTSDGKVTTSDGKVTTSDGKVTTSGGKVTTSGGKVTTSGGKVTTSGGKVTTSGGKVTTSDEVFSENVLQKIKSLGKRSKKSDLENLIAEMCQQSPLSIEEIAEYTKRTISYIRIKILPTLLREKRIKFLIPEMINHPNQKYTATK